MKPHPSDDAFCLVDWGDGWWPYRSEDGESPNVDNMEYPLNCPYGQPGDRLWVRETFFERDSDGETEVLGNMVTCDVKTISFAADGYSVPPGRKRPAIHLPRWASRILLEITAVRVERLQDISEADANAEGIKNLSLVVEEYGIPGDAHEYLRAGTPQLAYVKLWESINGAGSWDANPWVWVIEFKRLTP